ncbi:MAG: C40 family peptidase [Hydrogenophaga sp.]
MKSLIVVLALVCAPVLVQAAPPAAADAVPDALLVQKGLIGRLGEHLQHAREEVSDRASQLVVNAMGFLGVPYKFGGDDSEAGGLDCSGFVRAVYEQSFGQVLPRRASEQAASTQTIDRKELKPGDLVFFNTMKRAFSHVGIYVGDGQFIHAPRAGSNIRVEDMRKAYWQQRFNGARRVVSAAASEPGSSLPKAGE